jgi:hypothetical protein
VGVRAAPLHQLLQDHRFLLGEPLVAPVEGAAAEAAEIEYEKPDGRRRGGGRRTNDDDARVRLEARATRAVSSAPSTA